MRDGFEKLRRRLGDAVLAKERIVQRQRLTFGGAGHDLVAFGADGHDDFVDERRLVARINGHGIADFVAQAPAGEIDLEMARVFLRTGIEPAVNEQFSRERIGPRVG